MKKKILSIIGLLLIFGLGLTVTGCVDMETTHLYITNKSTGNIDILIEKQTFDNGGYNSWPETVFEQDNVLPDDDVYLKDEPNSSYSYDFPARYRIIITAAGGTKFYYPSDGNNGYTTIIGETRMIFDGERIRRE